MITIETKRFRQAVDGHEYSKDKIAILTDSSPDTMDKLYRGETDMRLSSIDKLAAYVGLDVIVSFKPKAREAVKA